MSDINYKLKFVEALQTIKKETKKSFYGTNRISF